MRGGNLSNDTAPSVGIRFERVIRTDEGKLNRSAKAYLGSLAGLDVNVYLITTGDPRRCMAFCAKWAVPYFTVVGADSTLEIPDICQEQSFVTYWDTDAHILSNVRSRGAPQVEAKQWTLAPVV